MVDRPPSSPQGAMGLERLYCLVTRVTRPQPLGRGEPNGVCALFLHVGAEPEQRPVQHTAGAESGGERVTLGPTPPDQRKGLQMEDKASNGRSSQRGGVEVYTEWGSGAVGVP